MSQELELVDTPEPLTDTERHTFLAYVAEHQDCSVREAAAHTGVKRQQIRHLKATDEDFAAEYQEARGYGRDLIRNELRRRAIEGVVEPVFGSLGGDAGSGIVGERRVYSDRLLGMMAKAHLPEYRDRLDAQVNVGGRVTHTHVEGYTLADILSASRSVPGLVQGARDEVPAAGELLAESDKGQPAPSDLPVRPAP